MNKLDYSRCLREWQYSKNYYKIVTLNDHIAADIIKNHEITVHIFHTAQVYSSVNKDLLDQFNGSEYKTFHEALNACNEMLLKFGFVFLTEQQINLL